MFHVGFSIVISSVRESCKKSNSIQEKMLKTDRRKNVENQTYAFYIVQLRNRIITRNNCLREKKPGDKNTEEKFWVQITKKMSSTHKMKNLFYSIVKKNI